MCSTKSLLYLFCCSFFFMSCLKVDIDPSEMNPDTEPTEPEPTAEEFIPWKKLDFIADRKILNTLGTPFEFYLITEDVFARFNRSNELIEKRPLDATITLDGKPVLSDNTFARLSTTNNGRQQVEFHLTRSPLEVQKFALTELDLVADDEHVEGDFLSRYPGAFSDDGVYFLLPTTTFPNHHYTCFLFEIRHTPSHNAFSSIEVIDRFEIPQLSSEYANLVNMKFINGHYYLATKEGGFRISPSGEVERILLPWMQDFFEYDDKIYATGFNDFDFYVSADNGASWDRLTTETDLKIVEVKGGKVFSQDLSLSQYQLASDDLTSLIPIKYNPDIEDEPDTFVTFDYFNGQFYFSRHKELYFNTQIQTY